MATSTKLRASDLIDELPDHLTVRSVSLAYRVGGLLVAAVMVLLPLLYVAIVAAAAWGVYWHATENISILKGTGSARGRLLLYSAPIVIGVVLVFFLLKPLLAPRRPRREPFALRREDQGLLFAFVEKLCDAIGAPRPKEIHIDCDLNASAGFHQGADFVRGGRVLTIGMPLVSGMTLRQFSGVLAHEFGHFSQGIGTRLSWVIALVNHWFARVVFERDAWDERLRGGMQAGGWLSIVAAGARFCVWLTRKILFGLMWIGRVVSSFLSRQMEFDADRYQIELIGSRGTESAFRRLAILGPVWGATQSRLSEAWEEKRLPSDVTSLMRLQEKDLDDETRQKLLARLEDEETELFGSHPRTIDRIDAALAAEVEGCFGIKAPASVLFRDYPRICQEATWGMYRDALGRSVSREHLIPAEQILEQQREAGAERATLQRYTGDMHNIYVPIRIAPVAVADPAAIAEEVAQLKERIPSLRARHDQVFSELSDALTAKGNAEAAGHMLRIKVRIDPKPFGLSGKKAEHAREAGARAESRREAAENELRGLQATVEKRWGLALGYLSSDAATPQGDASFAEQRDEMEKLVPVVARLDAAMGELSDILHQKAILHTLMLNLADASDNDSLAGLCDGRGGRLRTALREFVDGFAEVAYPFEHGRGQISVKDYIDLPSLPPRQPGATLEAAELLHERLWNLNARCAARLAVIAETAEEALLAGR